MRRPMNEGQSQASARKKALSFVLGALLPVFGAAALAHADIALAEVVPATLGLDVEKMEQPLIPAPDAAADPSEQTTPGAALAIDEVPAQIIPGGVASWYGAQFDGKRTASGERFDPDEMTAAHRTLPFGSRVRVKSARTGKSVIVRINDRGPFGHGRVIDLSQAAAREIGLTQAGSGTVELALLDR